MKVGDIVHVVNPSEEFLEAVFVDNMMDLGSVKCDAIIAKLRQPDRLWKITEIHDGTPSDEDDPSLASIEGVGFRCDVPSMIETSSLVLAEDQTLPKKQKR